MQDPGGVVYVRAGMVKTPAPAGVCFVAFVSGATGVRYDFYLLAPVGHSGEPAWSAQADAILTPDGATLCSLRCLATACVSRRASG